MSTRPETFAEWWRVNPLPDEVALLARAGLLARAIEAEPRLPTSGPWPST
jgi:hypothetical protein